MAVGNNNNVKVPATYVTWAEANITVAVGEEVTVAYTGTGRPLVQSNVEGFLNGIATANTATANSVTFTGVSAGTATIPYDSLVGQSIYTASVLEITVTAATEDESYLNKRGLAHFWGNIDSAKQNKLTAGSHITINNDTISATQPTVNNATLTIKQNSTTLGTFTANASTGTTVTISTPTRTTIYSNSSGTNANFSTTSAMSNYDDVEITFRDGNSNYATRTVPGSAGSFVLDISHPGGSSTVYWYISRFIVGGTNITVGANNVRKALQATGLTTTASQDIYITKMVGIKY